MFKKTNLKRRIRMDTIGYNIIYYAVLIFAVLAIVYGLFGPKGVVAYIKGEIPASEVARVPIGVAIACFIIWAALDLLAGPKESSLILKMGKIFETLLSEIKLNPFQPK
jgi:hypothetical protein